MVSFDLDGVINFTANSELFSSEHDVIRHAASFLFWEPAMVLEIGHWCHSGSFADYKSLMYCQ